MPDQEDRLQALEALIRTMLAEGIEADWILDAVDKVVYDEYEDDEPVTDDDRSNGPGKLGHRGESDLDLILLGGLIMALIFLLGGLWMDGTIDFRPWEFIRYTIEAASRP